MASGALRALCGQIGRLAAVLLPLAAFQAHAADAEAEQARTGGRTESNWNLGPFFQYRRAAPGASSFWAVRPLWSQVDAPASGTFACDGLWPLGTYHEHNNADWWRAALVVYGDGRGDGPEWSFNVFPLWFSGCDRKDNGYWGFFPFYGHHPHFLFMDDWDFVLWPAWQSYSVKGVRSRSVLWPFVTWRDSPREGAGVWPFYGTATQRESDHGYLLWPFVTWADYREDRDTSGSGSSWMFWPFYGRIRRARESQTLVLPPFFSYAATDKATRWRMPWPLVDVLRSSVRDRISVWPFYETVDGYSYADGGRKEKVEERTRRYGWYLVEDSELESGRTLETRFSVFPFWTSERRYAKAKDGSRREVASYTRVWPFWSSTTEKGRSRQRVLELSPIRHSEGLERNWSPFWTFWECRDRPDGRKRHSLFWHLVTWHTGERTAHHGLEEKIR